MGIQTLTWKEYNELFLPKILKMVELKHTSVNRFAAANIIAASINYSAECENMPENLMQTYLSLCGDPDIIIRKEMLSNCNILLAKLKEKEYANKLKDEVLIKVA